MNPASEPAMIRILLINPNTSWATTDMMLAIARAAAPEGVTIEGATARSGVTMIVDPVALREAADEVVALGKSAVCDGIVVAAFGDPGVDRLRTLAQVPVAGIAEAALLEAAEGSRRFGVATVTPALSDAIAARVADLGLTPLYTGIRLTAGDPAALAGDPRRLVEALADAVAHCIDEDGAGAVVIGGGPLGDAATALAARFDVPIVAPIPAAIRRILAAIAER